MWSKFKDAITVVLLTSFYWLLSRTWRIKHLDLKGNPFVEAGPSVYAHWHGDELVLIGAYVNKAHAVMVSRSRDGERLRKMLGWLGYHIVRGSSSRGGAGGLKGLVDAVAKEGHSASLAVDGPRGPVYEVKPGIIKLAQATRRPLIPGAAACSKRITFHKAWNKCFLPLPFARAAVMYGEPIEIPREANAEELEVIRLQLQASLTALKGQVEALFNTATLPAAQLRRV